MFKTRFSWRAVLAGVVTALAVSMIMGMLGIALGFTVIDPMSNTPFSGLGTTFGIWSILTIIVSLAAGGYMAGFLGGVRGYEHGFMTWATLLLVGAIIGMQAMSSAARTVGSAVETVGSGAASVVSGVGGGIADLASGAVDYIGKNVNIDFEPQEMAQDVSEVLADTGIPTLQPDYLQGQIRAARADLRSTLNQIRLDANNYDAIIGAFLDKQQNRLATITSDNDRDNAVAGLKRTRNLTRPEAEQAVDSALALYNRSVNQAKYAIDEAREEVHEAREYINTAMAQARVKADEFADTAAKSMFAAALSLLLGAAVAMLAAHFGSRHWLRRTEDFEIFRTTEI
ncbi:MAG: YrzE family protein, partial [Planctomycetes bacterium]|nr:YrzE family protein [Planctomycetota bacterium]